MNPRAVLAMVGTIHIFFAFVLMQQDWMDFHPDPEAMGLEFFAGGAVVLGLALFAKPERPDV